MRRVFLSLCLLSVVALGARADDDLPSVNTVPCVVKCANSTPAAPVRRFLPSYPQVFRENEQDGYVGLRFTVGTDGHVTNIVLEKLIGPKRFADMMTGVVEDWVYTPATIDGKPVEQSLVYSESFRVVGKIPGVRQPFLAPYKDISDLISTGKLDEAGKKLKELQTHTELNFYERGTLAALLAPLLLHQHDDLGAYDVSRDAVYIFRRVLPPQVQAGLVRNYIIASIAVGDFVEAGRWATFFRTMDGADRKDPIIDVAARELAKIKAAPQFATRAKIPLIDEGGDRVVDLGQRDFAFYDVAGSLDSFQLICRQGASTSKISGNAEWHVPPDWNDCKLAVRGAPGTTFSVMQFAPGSPTAAPQSK